MIMIGALGVFLHNRLLELPAFRALQSRSVDDLQISIQNRLTKGIRAIDFGRLDFDLSVQLSGGPVGLAYSDGQFITANKLDPWGFLAATERETEKFDVEKTAVREKSYGQKVAFAAGVWNGKTLVSIAYGSWFQSPHQTVLVTHDPQTLEIVSFYPAPDNLSRITWDGNSYWACTRSNTRDSGEPMYLYQIDEQFNVIGTFPSLGVGCQGLEWDGQYLWAVDVFSDAIDIYELKANGARRIHSYVTDFDYLSGITYDGEDIWVTEYGSNRLYRLDSRLRKLWEDGNFAVRHHEMFRGIPYLERFAEGSEPLSKLIAPIKNKKIELAELPYLMDWLVAYGMKEELRVFLQALADSDEDEGLRQFANRELDRLEEGKTAREVYARMDDPEAFSEGFETLEEELTTALESFGDEIARQLEAHLDEGVVVVTSSGEESADSSSSSDEYNNALSNELTEDDAGVENFSIELLNDSLYGSWSIYFGTELFQGIWNEGDNDTIAFPTFAQYTISVSGGNLEEPAQVTFDADPGDNEGTYEELSSELGPGTYTVSLEINVQYTDGDGNKSLNRSVPNLSVTLP